MVVAAAAAVVVVMAAVAVMMVVTAVVLAVVVSVAVAVALAPSAPSNRDSVHLFLLRMSRCLDLQGLHGVPLPAQLEKEKSASSSDSSQRTHHYDHVHSPFNRYRFHAVFTFCDTRPHWSAQCGAVKCIAVRCCGTMWCFVQPSSSGTLAYPISQPITFAVS